MTIELFLSSREAPSHFPVRKWKDPFKIKNGSYMAQGIYMTTIYDEMPRMTDEEILEWKRDNLENRIREALVQARLIKSTLTDLSNLTTNAKVTQADSLAWRLEQLIQEIINELPKAEIDL
jgi:hypothetical protein